MQGYKNLRLQSNGAALARFNHGQDIEAEPATLNSTSTSFAIRAREVGGQAVSRGLAVMANALVSERCSLRTRALPLLAETIRVSLYFKPRKEVGA